MMGRPQKDEIDTFKSVTGASEAVALRKLEEHGGDLNAALNAHFSEGERANSRPIVVPVIDNDDIMDVDQPIDVETVGPSFPLLGDSRSFNPFSLLEEHMGRNSFRGRGIDDARSRAPRVLHPREVREIPIDFKDDSSHSGLSNHGPNIEYLAESEYIGPATFGHVTLDEVDEDHEPIAHNAGVPSQFRERYDPRHHDNVVPETSTSVVADNNDIEEEMIKAAIEASKLDAQRPPSPDLDVLNTTEQERTLDEGFPFDQISHVTSPVEELERKAKIKSTNNRRQEPGASTSGTSTQILPENMDEQPLTRRNSRNTTASSTSKEAILLDDSPPSSPLARSIAAYPQNNGAAADEWGGMTSEEHDEAVMLEAAMFGGIPEREPYSIRSTSYYNARANRPPSPTLAAERLLREQQDDEYQAALQADRERELKETAAREAALQKERTLEEEMRKRRLEEEEFERELTAKSASLPEEPSANDENAMTLLVRMPDGSRRGRRFRKSDKLQSLFDFIDSERVAKPKTYKLVRPYPRRAFGEEESDLSFGDLGMTSKQEALFLELI